MNRNIILVVGLVFLVAMFVPVINGSPVGMVIYDKVQGIGEYEYTGVSGESYTFDKTRIGQNLRHILSFEMKKISDNGRSVIKTAKIPFRYGPEELEKISMEYVRRDILFSEVIYVTRDKNLEGTEISPVAIPTIGRILDSEWDTSLSLFEIPTGLASTVAMPYEDLPVISCGQSTPERTVIEFRHGDENKIYAEGECVIVESKGYDDSIKVATKLAYHVLGIM